MAETVGQKTQAKGNPGRHDTETGRHRNRDTHKQRDTASDSGTYHKHQHHKTAGTEKHLERMRWQRQWDKRHKPRGIQEDTTQRHRNRDTHKQGDKETEIHTSRETQKQRYCTHKQEDTETEIHTNRETQKQRYTQTGTHRNSAT